MEEGHTMKSTDVSFSRGNQIWEDFMDVCYLECGVLCELEKDDLLDKKCYQRYVKQKN